MRRHSLLAAVGLALFLGGCAADAETSSADSTDALSGAPNDPQPAALGKALDEARLAYNAADTNEVTPLAWDDIKGSVEQRIVNSPGFKYDGLYFFKPRASSSTYELLVLKKQKSDPDSVIWFYRNEPWYVRELGSCVAHPQKPLTECTPAR